MTVRSIVIKGINWVGDTILTTPAISALHRGFPEAAITVVARPWVAALLEANEDITDVWEVDERNRLKFLAVAARIRRQRFDLGILFPNSFASALLLALGGVRRRVGYDRDGRRFLLRIDRMRGRSLSRPTARATARGIGTDTHAVPPA